MGLFGSGKSKSVQVNTSIKYKNNITERLSSMLTPRYADASVYIVESGDPKFMNIMIDGSTDILGVITRDKKNIATNIGIYTRGVISAFQAGAEKELLVYTNRIIENVRSPY